MILLDYSESMVASDRAVKNAQPKETDNKNLWKLALEKNSLYMALNKFESISNHLKTEESLKPINLPQARNNFNNTTDTASATENSIIVSLKGSIGATFKDAEITNFINRNNSRLNVLSRGLLYESVLNKSIVALENNVVIGSYKDLAKSSQWLNKNAVVTVANSNLEVWIRDASLTGNKLSDILKNIKQSMAELGASLSKLSINGKVAFDREK